MSVCVCGKHTGRHRLVLMPTRTTFSFAWFCLPSFDVVPGCSMLEEMDDEMTNTSDRLSGALKKLDRTLAITRGASLPPPFFFAPLRPCHTLNLSPPPPPTSNLLHLDCTRWKTIVLHLPAPHHPDHPHHCLRDKIARCFPLPSPLFWLFFPLALCALLFSVLVCSLFVVPQ